MRNFHLIAICAILLIACGEREAESSKSSNPDEPGGAWPATQMSSGGSFTLTVAPTKPDIVQNEHFSLDLSIDPKDGRAGSLQVKVDADMPAHRHGMNTLPELSQKGAGHYQVDGMLFHMAGEWVITVEVTRGGKTEHASFPVQVE